MVRSYPSKGIQNIALFVFSVIMFGELSRPVVKVLCFNAKGGRLTASSLPA